jgi:hypothetical protein
MRKDLIEEELYKNASINDLIIFGIYSLTENGKKCDFEALVGRCFTFFPKAFSFFQYPKWPDSRKLDRPLRALRDAKMITGSPKNLFSLTARGKKKALEIAKIFRQGKLL